MAWDYERNESNGFEPIPEGKYRIRIKEAEKAVSKSGNDMLVLKFEVSGQKGLIFHYIVFMQDRPEITNRNLTKFFDSFAGIPEGDLDTSHWIGKVGAAEIKHEEYNGNVNAKINYFISRDKQDTLPNWQEPDGTTTNADGFMNIPDGAGDDGLPF